MITFLARVTSNDLDIPQGDFSQGSVSTLLQITFGIAAGIALIILMLAGMKYILSRGDPAAVAKAKNTIIYAVIGLAIAASAFSIVTFVVKAL